MTAPNALFCPTNSLKAKYIQFNSQKDGTVKYFCSIEHPVVVMICLSTGVASVRAVKVIIQVCLGMAAMQMGSCKATVFDLRVGHLSLSFAKIQILHHKGQQKQNMQNMKM